MKKQFYSSIGLIIDIFSFSNLAAEVQDADEDSRIINGTVAGIEQFPYQLSFRLRGRHICGAAIISRTRGLTAAHCFNGHHHVSFYSVLAGVLELSDEKSGQVRPLTQLIAHPDFHRITLRNDIAVFWFEEPFVFGPRIAAIRLPPQNEAVKPIGFIAGWGLTSPNNMTSLSNTLLFAVKTKISNQFCDSLYAGINRITFQMFCTHDAEVGVDACTGDDGGAYASGRYIFGIISWAFRCAHSKFPRVYTQVASYIDWIEENANLTAAA